MSPRKIVEPGIIQERIEKRESNNLWYYIGAINRGLEKNPISSDEIIEVEFFFAIDQHMIDQIVKKYTNVGWMIDVSLTTAPIGVFSGNTLFEFYIE